MFTFLLIVQTLIAAALVTVILMQRSEGGGLGVSSSSAGLMTARGAADFLTRATSILATLFVLLSIALAALAASRGGSNFDTSLKSAPVAPVGVPMSGAPAPVPAPGVAPAPAAPATAPAGNTQGGVPLAQ
jgi:preprotein translocase subunit SecG